MRLIRTIAIALAALAAVVVGRQTALRADTPPSISSFSKPAAGSMQIFFHGSTGPFLIQSRQSVDAPWTDVPDASVTEIESGVFLGLVPSPSVPVDLGLYRVVSYKDSAIDLNGWTVLLSVSAPTNGVYFVAGEAPVVSVNILDTYAQGITPSQLSSLNLYLDGPQDPLLTKTAVKLLNATSDRSKNPHHYINLKASPDVQVNGTVLKYALKPVTDEAPGTYTISVWASLATDGTQQIMTFANVQIGTTNVESPVVTKVQCASCHQGAVSGKLYMHHIDPGFSPTGNWALDYSPVTSCKACHNNDGYAAYTDATGTNRVSDNIVIRVHGVHMGEGLKLPFNTNTLFADYVDVAFPANVRNCTACHVDDRWKTQPSMLACGTCHDNVWFGDKNQVPAGMVGHTGGPMKNDSGCALCHVPDENSGGVFPSIAENHKVEPLKFNTSVSLDLTPPANGNYYVAGEAPKVNIKLADAATGTLINPTNIVEPLVSTNVQPNEWRRANLMVAGPRALTVPVLTTAAANKQQSTYANNDFRVRVDPAKEDPRVTRTDDTVVYQLDDVTNLAAGTYTVYVEVLGAVSTNLGATVYKTFQVGTTNVEKLVAGNCTACHGSTMMHAENHAIPFDTDACKVCHDYLHQYTGKTNWSNSQWGFGTAPISRRVHGVHFGNYLDKPKQINPGADYSHLIFPQDVRNCTTCHTQSTTWKENPSRLACMACHDSDSAIAHGNLMTWNLNPQDPFAGGEVETCEVCHGKDAEFSPDKVHAISNPYVPPYPRALRE